MKVIDFAFVGHAVSDLQRARKFYEEVLRLPPPAVLNGDLDGDKGFFEYQVGSNTIAITTWWTDNKPPEHPARGLLLEVENFEEAIEHIKKCGAPIVFGPIENPGCLIAVIADPDGNEIGIHKLK